MPKMNITKKLLLICIAFGLSACDTWYPLVANGYNKAITIKITDSENQGLPQLIEPLSCIHSFQEIPTIKQIQIFDLGKLIATYGDRAILAAYNNNNANDGSLVVNESGLFFYKNYKCKPQLCNR